MNAAEYVALTQKIQADLEEKAPLLQWQVLPSDHDPSIFYVRAKVRIHGASAFYAETAVPIELVDEGDLTIGIRYPIAAKIASFLAGDE